MALQCSGVTYSDASLPLGRYGQRSHRSGHPQWETLLFRDGCARGRPASLRVHRGTGMALPGAIGLPCVEFTPVLLTVRADEGVRNKRLPHMEATHTAELPLLD